MRIKARMGVSIDGYVASPDGVPALVKSGDFVPGQSHGYPEFIKGCDTVVMGRNTFLPALSAPSWPWEEMQVFVLTSRPLPADMPSTVVAATGGPASLVQQLRTRGSDGDVHLVGGPRTIHALHEVGGLDSLEAVVLPVAPWRRRSLVALRIRATVPPTGTRTPHLRRRVRPTRVRNDLTDID